MKTKVLMIVLSLILASEVFARGPRGGNCDGQGPGQGQGQGRGWRQGEGRGMMQARLQELNLTSEQKEAFMNLKQTQREEMRVLQEKKKSLQKEFRDLLQKGDASQTDSKIQELTDIFKSTLKLRVAHFQKLKNLLTAEQLKKLQEDRDSEE